MSSPSGRAPKPVVILRPARRSARPRRSVLQGMAPGVLALTGFAALLGGGWWLLQRSQPPVTVQATAEPTPGPEESAMEQETAAAQALLEAVAMGEAAAPAAPAVDPGKPALSTQEAPAVKETDPFQKLLVMDAMGGAKPENAAWHAASWELAKNRRLFAGYRDLLAKSLQAYVATARVTPAQVVAGKWSGPALSRYAFLKAIPDPVLKEAFASEETREFTLWLLENPEAMQAFLRQLSDRDDVAKALQTWAGLAAEYSSAKSDYRELAIAVALVFDETVQADHDRYGGPIPAASRFEYFHSRSEAGKLTGKIKKMTAADLVWVVGVPVSAKELEWALKEADFRQKSWGQAYGSIKYDMERAVAGKNSYDEYTFAEIRKKGGICSDQSYFAAWTACAHGIPAAIISGDGARGPHAWITWQAEEMEWKFSGRFDGYPAGHCRNPQTGEEISEEEFLRLSDKKASQPSAVLEARQAMWLAQAIEGQPDQAGECLTAAVKAAPRYAPPSLALLAHWVKHRSTAPVEEWEDFIKTLRRDFRDSKTVMTAVEQAEDQCVFPRRDATLVMKDLRREGRKTGDTAGSKAGMAAELDRLTGGLRRQAEVIAATGNPDGIRSLYRRALADHGDDAATFKVLAVDYFSWFQSKPELAGKVCRELEQACRRSVGRGQGDWFDITSQNSAWRSVAECYRSAGETDKADSIVRDCDSREKTARKRAI